jgi:hypothetical protein
VRFDIRIGPGGVLEFGRHGGCLGGIKAWADEIEDAAELEIIATTCVNWAE